MGNIFTVARKVKRLKMDNTKKKTTDVTKPTDINSEKIENTDSFIERFKLLFNSPYLSDITLCVNGDRYYAHKFLLVTVSEVFEAMLKDKWQESTQKEVSLSEEIACKDVFSKFLRYLYCGSVELDTDCTLPILILADKYSVKPLQKACVEYMMRHIVASPDTNRTLTWYGYAKMTGQDELFNECRKFILCNFHVILEAQDWTALSKPEILEFLNSSSMIVKSEIDLWLHVERWLMTETDKSVLEKNLEDLLPLVRFHMILPKNLLQIESSQLYTNFPILFKEKLSAAYRYHSLSIDCEDMNQICEPFRNYLGEEYKICFPFTLKNYHDTERIESKISVKGQIPLGFVCPSHQLSNKQSVSLQIYFYPQGFFSVITLYGSYIGRRTSNTTLRIIQRMQAGQSLSLEVTLVLYSMKNALKYISFTHTSKHLLTDGNSFESQIGNVIDIEKFSGDSPYLIDGDLEGKIFIKVLDIGEHLKKLNVKE